MEAKNGDQFIIDDFLNYSTEDDEEMVAVSSPTTTAVSTVTGSSSTSEKSSSSSFSSSCSSNRLSKLSQIYNGKEIIAGRNVLSSFEDFLTFTSEYDRQLELELEWVSNFYEDKFSAEDLEKQQLISGRKKTSQINKLSPEKGSTTATTAMLGQENRVTGKPRSKRSRSVPRNWTSRLPPGVLPSPSAAAAATTTSNMSSASCHSSSSSYDYSDITTNSTGKKAKKSATATLLKEEKEFRENVDATINGGREGKKCFHCATDKTPQWRTGPMGPKTLCNACGVRYKSGRLVPEYRPASSPTFVLTKHSNSHRKVLELRKQKEEDIVRTHQNPAQQWRRQQFLEQKKIIMFDLCNNGDIEMDFGRLKQSLSNNFN